MFEHRISSSDGRPDQRVNRILEDLLRLCILDFGGTWEEHLPLVEFSYNNSFQSSIGMAPFEALYGRPCRSPTCWWESTDEILHGPIWLRRLRRRLVGFEEGWKQRRTDGDSTRIKKDGS